MLGLRLGKEVCGIWSPEWVGLVVEVLGLGSLVESA